jgi:endonuclease YncB( thermonuclease family)
MGTVHKFRRRPKNAGQFRGGRISARRFPMRRAKRRWRWGYKQAMLVTLGVSIGGLIAISSIQWKSSDAPAADFECSSARVLDGDTFDCGATRVRLAGIDAPELEGHCRPGRRCAPGDPYASTEHLRQLVSGARVQCRRTDTDVYGRAVARCTTAGTDLSCAQIGGGYAIRRYGIIFC